jgi:ArsR family transcriptional regulator, lead/cadmium/zinc/bismuth-responsive transcriptional repressor
MTALSLLADPVRAQLLYALDVATELCVGDVALALQVSEDRAAYSQVAEGFPEPLRVHCLRRLVELTHTAGDDD